MTDKERTLASLRQMIDAAQQSRGPVSLIRDDEALLVDEEPEAPSTKARQKESKQKDLTAQGAFNRIVVLLSYAPRTRLELRKRLVQEGFASGIVEDALNRAEACLLINDESYAEHYALTRIERGIGLSRIKQELRQKGVDVDACEFWQELSQTQDLDAQFQRALSYANTHIPTTKQPGKSLYGSLIRRGYSSECAFRVLNALELSLYD